MKSFNDLDLLNNQITNVVYDKRSTPPSNPQEGQYYYNTTDKCLYTYNGTEWVKGSGGGTVNGITAEDTGKICTLPDSI